MVQRVLSLLILWVVRIWETIEFLEQWAEHAALFRKALEYRIERTVYPMTMRIKKS